MQNKPAGSTGHTHPVPASPSASSSQAFGFLPQSGGQLCPAGVDTAPRSPSLEPAGHAWGSVQTQAGGLVILVVPDGCLPQGWPLQASPTLRPTLSQVSAFLWLALPCCWPDWLELRVWPRMNTPHPHQYTHKARSLTPSHQSSLL